MRELKENKKNYQLSFFVEVAFHFFSIFHKGLIRTTCVHTVKIVNKNANSISVVRRALSMVG